MAAKPPHRIYYGIYGIYGGDAVAHRSIFYLLWYLWRRRSRLIGRYWIIMVSMVATQSPIDIMYLLWYLWRRSRLISGYYLFCYLWRRSRLINPYCIYLWRRSRLISYFAIYGGDAVAHIDI